MKTLTLTIVIPIYNEEDHIDVCLASISDQTVMPLEVIVVDNNSTDNGAHIAASYDFVRVISEPKQGIAPARDAGFEAARGDIIGRIDADTVLPETWVEEVLDMYRDRQDFALTGGGYFYNISLPGFNSWALSQIAFRVNRFIMGHYILWGSNMAMPREFWQAVKHDVCTHNNDIHEDLDLAIHLHALGYPIVFKENIKVGVEMKRVYSGNRPAFRRNLNLWPETLKAHAFHRAWLGTLGAHFLYYGTFALMLPADQAIKAYQGLRGLVSRTDP